MQTGKHVHFSSFSFCNTDLQMWGSVQFRPYFLVFILVIAIVYAALLHPREIYSLVYGLAYALLFPAMFVILPVYALSNMTDQSWGTREVNFLVFVNYRFIAHVSMMKINVSPGQVILSTY